METFKRTDLLVNITLITGCTIFSLAKFDYTFIYCYFITGGWQVISMLAHTANGWFTRKKSSRYNYHCTVAVIIAMGILTFVIQFLAFIYFIMLFAAPLMALYYTSLCYDEIKVIRERHSLALK